MKEFLGKTLFGLLFIVSLVLIVIGLFWLVKTTWLMLIVVAAIVIISVSYMIGDILLN